MWGYLLIMSRDQQAKLFQFLVKSPRSAVEMGHAKHRDDSDSYDDDDPAEAENC